MATDLAPAFLAPRLLSRLGRFSLGILTYLGGLGLLTVSVVRALLRPHPGAPALGGALVRQWDWMFSAGLSLVSLAHIGMGSFLAMQAYYGATFVEAVGPVVGVGLCRNVAPLLAGLVMAGLLAARLTPELSRRPLVELDDDSLGVADREVARGRQADPRTPPDPARLTAVRVVAAMVAGPVLGLCGTLVGTAVGWLVALQLLAVPTPIFFAKMLEMLWLRDAVGVIVKGVAFGAVAAIFPCYEALRVTPMPRPLAEAATLAACRASVAILILNGSWYLLVYMAGPAFGPTVLRPPSL